MLATIEFTEIMLYGSGVYFILMKIICKNNLKNKY